MVLSGRDCNYLRTWCPKDQKDLVSWRQDLSFSQAPLSMLPKLYRLQKLGNFQACRLVHRRAWLPVVHQFLCYFQSFAMDPHKPLETVMIIKDFPSSNCPPLANTKEGTTLNK